jgi:hypothetical protein
MPAGVTTSNVPSAPRSTRASANAARSRVDHLHRLTRRRRREHVTAGGHAGRPVREAAGGVERPDDQAGAQDDRPAGERVLHRALAGDLQRAVALAGDLVARRVRRHFGQGAGLVESRHGVVGVDAAARDEQVARRGRCEQSGRALDVGREVARHVDDRVEATPAQAVEAPRPLAGDVLGLREEPWPRAAAVEQGEVVVALECERRQMPPGEARASKDE